MVHGASSIQAVTRARCSFAPAKELAGWWKTLLGDGCLMPLIHE